ncbi:MAG: tetrahydromethanopterin S-methyltransferase subunit A, partial [Planctomycetes bacterium]|nr:tetrahydromethanopterin S-methyltransferase subunit A [Planctomycetota bacterium]
MSIELNIIGPALDEACAQLREAAAARKCWRCGCLHNSLAAVEQAVPEGGRPGELDGAIREARGRLVEVQYDCLGCDVCYPAIALNALNRAGFAVEPEACPAERVEARVGWPPLPGSYQVLRYTAPVAVCTLTDEGLTYKIAAQPGAELSIVGTLQTENLGIERLIENTVGNPHIRFLVLAGADSRSLIGHLPGQSLLALARSGVDERMRIIGARGKRPILRNLTREAVEHFRRTVEMVDLRGEVEPEVVLDAMRGCAARNSGPAEPFAAGREAIPIQGYVPERMTSDPAGYFVVYVDRDRNLLSLEHYANSGVLDAIIEGSSPAELYVAAIDRGLLSRLDHAAYLGRELAR